MLLATQRLKGVVMDITNSETNNALIISINMTYIGQNCSLYVDILQYVGVFHHCPNANILSI